MFNIKPAIEKDLITLTNICLKTANNGGDASALIRQPDLLADLYVAPYFYAEDSSCLIAVERNIICGYLVATQDTKKYIAWLNSDWLPSLRKKYSMKNQYLSSLEQYLVETIHQNSSPPRHVKRYPAHVHISLLPEAQRLGMGRQLLNYFEQQIIGNSGGYYVTVSEENTAAQLFFLQQKLVLIHSDNDSFVLVKSLPC